VDGANIEFRGVNSSLPDRVPVGNYTLGFGSDFPFDNAEIAISRNSEDGAGNIVIYEYTSGSFSVDAESEIPSGSAGI
jgi:hypothetical protein